MFEFEKTVAETLSLITNRLDTISELLKKIYKTLAMQDTINEELKEDINNLKKELAELKKPKKEVENKKTKQTYPWGIMPKSATWNSYRHDV